MGEEKPLVCVIDSAVVPLLTETGPEGAALAGSADVELVTLDSPGAIPEVLRRATGLIVGSASRITRELMAQMPLLRVVVRNGVGYDNIDVEAARELGIAVSNVPDYCTEEVADHAITLVLALERHLFQALNGVRAGQFSWKIASPVRRLRGQTFGIAGCGRIGTAVALRAKALGFRVVIFDPYAANGYERALGVERVRSLAALLTGADVVSLHAPLTAETRGMIGTCELSLMKPGAFLVNTARGPMVQEAPLIAALDSGRLGGVALDVLEREPTFDPALTRHPGCLITPHMAFYSHESMDDVRVLSAETVLDALQGRTPRNVVNGVRFEV